MSKAFIAIDLGASSGRTMLGILEDNHLTIKEINRFWNGPNNVEGVLRWSFTSLLSNIKDGIRLAEAEHPISAIAIDTWGVDSFADEGEYGPERSQNPKGIANPAHHYFLTQAGVHTLENFNLKGLAKDNVELSCVIILPLLTKGSSASPIRPVAIGVSAGI